MANLTGKTIGQLALLTGITQDTLFAVELSGATYHIPYSGLSVGGSYEEVTYDELYSLYSGGTLNPVGYYLITDFQSIYDQPDFDYSGQPIITGNSKTGITEPLLVFATSSTTLSNQAFSPLYPKDKITYDITFTTTEVSNTPAKGRITERIDEFNNRTDYDNRTILFKRYKLFTFRPNQPLNGTIQLFNNGTISGTNTTFTTLTVGNVVYIPSTFPSYYEIVSISGNTEMIVSGDTITAVAAGQEIFLAIEETNDSNGYFSYKRTNVKTNDFTEYTTFGDAISNDYAKNTYVGNLANNYQTAGTFLLANNVFLEGAYESNKFGDYCYNNTFGTDNQNNIWGDWCFENVSTNDMDDNIIGHYFFGNLINVNFTSNQINNNFNSNKLLAENDEDFNGNIIGDFFNANTIYSWFYSNEILNNFGSNIIGDFDDLTNFEFYGNRIGNDFLGNSIRQNFQSNQIGNLFEDNVITDNFYKNQTGFGFFNNDISGETYNNRIGEQFENNTIYGSFNDNQIFNEFKGNITYQSFSENRLDWGFGSNQISGSCSDNTFGPTIDSNDFLGSVYGNIFKGAVFGNTIGDNFATNNIGFGFSDNIIGEGFGYGAVAPQGNIIGNGFIGNTIGEYFYNNSIPDNFYENEIGDYFQWNVINTNIDRTYFTLNYGNITGFSYTASGTSATDTIYTNLTGTTNGHGVSATFDVEVSGGTVTGVSGNTEGRLYKVNDTLTILGTQIGGVTGVIDVFSSDALGKSGTTGSYTGITASGTGGENATFDITVSGGVVTDIQLNNGGEGYSVNETLTIAGSAFSGTSGITITVDSLYSDDVVITVTGTTSGSSFYQHYTKQIFERRLGNKRVSFYDEDDILNVDSVYEISGYIPVYSQVISFPLNNASFEFQCDGSYTNDTSYTGVEVGNAQELVTLFNNNFRQFGYFFDNNDGSIGLYINPSLKQQYCPNGTYTIDVFND
jgi:hypothetical protein